jgi:glycosyltransferase involved in cell wall biosynthesis
VHVLPRFQREAKPLKDLQALHEIRRLIRRTQPDLIHAHTSKAGFLGRLAARSLRVPCIYTIHSWLFGTPALSRIWGILGAPCERVAARWCDRLIAVSEEGARVTLTQRIAAPSKVVTIHNGMRDCPDRAHLKASDSPVITMVARFTPVKETPVKEHEVLLRAFATLPRGPRLCLAGEGPCRVRCQQLAQELGISDRVDFLGDCQNVPELLARSDVFVLASQFEMLPLSVLEAMRAGLPVIASNVGGVGETIVHGQSGLLVPSGSVTALAQTLAQVVGDYRLRVSLGRAARQRFVERFLYEQQEARTRAVYWEVLLAAGRVAPEFAETAWAA